MSKCIIAIIIMIISLNLSALETDSKYLSIIISLKNGSYEDKIGALNELNKIIPEDEITAFERYYLISLCYYSDEREEMQNVILNLEKSKLALEKIPEIDTIGVAEFVIQLSDIYSSILDFSDFTYNDLEEVIDLIFEQFSIRIDICRILNDYRIAKELKEELFSFKDNLLSEKKNYQEKVISMMDDVDKIMLTKIGIKNIRKN